MLGALGAHVAVPCGGVWGVVGCSARMLWRLGCVSRCVECSALRRGALMCLGCPRGCAVWRGWCWVGYRGSSEFLIPVRVGT